MSIPPFDPGPDTLDHIDEYVAATERVLRSGQFILGPEVAEFEDEFGQYVGVDHAIGVNSGTDALVIALEAMGVGPGDEVITTPFTFFATSEAIGRVGADVVFADIDPTTLNIDPDAVSAVIGPRTRAMIPVHLFGLAADMEALTTISASTGVAILEDVAQATGARHDGRRTGSIGVAGAFSFFPTKNLGAFGDGGMITTSDDDVAAAATALRKHGASGGKYHNERLGYNSRLDAIQAALLRVKLGRLDTANTQRRSAAARYTGMIGDLDEITLPVDDGTHVFHQYTVRISGNRRDAVRSSMADQGVTTMVYYPVPLHRLPVYADRGESFPVSERAASEVLSLPIWPSIDSATQEKVAAALRSAMQ